MNDLTIINFLKGLVIDGVHQANAGHPGGAMSSMDFAYHLFKNHLRFDPDDHEWLGRDRFILSAGHESMLQYSLLHAIGWLPIDELKRFRRLHSKTPGHPENTETAGVECTTGPLGQGVAMSVGFAIAAKHLAAKVDADLFSQRIFALMGDGCMQEEITLGAASFAGHLRLNNLIWYYDRNAIQISGDIRRSTSDDEATVFRGFGWDVHTIDAHDHAQIQQCLNKVLSSQRTRPTLIIGKSVMAKGAATMEGSHHTHGSPLPAAEREATKLKFGIPAGETFYFPNEARQKFQEGFEAKREAVGAWKEKLHARKKDKSFNQTFDQYFGSEDMSRLTELPWDKALATRNAFGETLAAWAPQLPKLVGGSADLEPSNMTEAFAKLVGDFQAETPQGRNFAFGVREFPMSAICNGIALHGGLIPFDATFLCFSDYARPALRLGAIQRVRVIHEYTHDSFYLGEDGPTHQAVEHVMSLRLMPDLLVMRPADGVETEVMMRLALQRQHSQSAICLSRQKLPIVARDFREHITRGAYVIHNDPKAEFIIFATGSEVSLALEVAKTVPARVVSMPCWEIFAEQPASYQEQVLDWSMAKRVSIEAGVSIGWQRFVGHRGLCISLDHFGASAPAEDLAKEYGFTTEAVCAKLRQHSF